MGGNVVFRIIIGTVICDARHSEFIHQRFEEKSISIVKAAVATQDGITIRSGYSANAEMVLDSVRQVVFVPESALDFDGDDIYVRLKDAEGKYKRVQVETGLSDGVNIEIKSGLKAGDIVRGPQIVEEEED